MSDLKKHIKNRVLFVGIILVLALLYDNFSGDVAHPPFSSDGSFFFLYLLIVFPILLLIGIIDLILLKANGKFTKAKFLTFLAIVTVLLLPILIIFLNEL